jgi:stage V sporulation protein AC
MESSEKAKKQYQDMVELYSPKSKIVTDCLRAFLCGGGICALGQFLSNTYLNVTGSKDTAGALTAVTLIFITILLTGLGVFDKFGKIAGAGSFVPITGFANAMSSPAIEFKREGLVLGIGAKMFTVAGPVIVYGCLASMLVGLVYYFLK